MTENDTNQADWTQRSSNDNSKGTMSFGLIALMLIVLGVAGGLAYYQTKNGGQMLVLEKCCEDILLGPKAALFVRVETPVRTKPSFDEGRTAYTYKRGTTVMGDVVLGPDGKTRWLKQKGDGWYMRTKDLSTGAPPRLTGARPDQNMTPSGPLEIRQIPNAKAPVMVTLPAGSAVQLVGTDKNGFTEVVFDHPTYRVGYIQGVGR
jgi:hypothetical protein